ncbi:hypothetical protein BN2475_1810002 [Paraburkholderia ribeironis]|uniref:Uncharacterized protein n=1 Tax=Paraburkholderia ribeironis TaxID=1247936 RepID=A0A1N7SR22_9BURK|nr:hypothetical protein BN2475_1810002 [Paraburkholderia ribeironis]
MRNLNANPAYFSTGWGLFSPHYRNRCHYGRTCPSERMRTRL